MEIDGSRDESERLVVLLSYGLMLIGPPAGGFTALIGAVIAHVRLDHARGSFHESHYRNQIRVFWTMLIYALAVLTALSFAMGLSAFSLLWPLAWVWPLHLVLLGSLWMMALLPLGLLSLAMVIWYYWRLLRGFVRELDDKPY